jgi:hypothetical protein
MGMNDIRHNMTIKIISGGQTGADRAALDFAIKHSIPHGGWLPKGRKTEDGRLSEKYQLQEMPTGSYSRRTEKNILDSDGTLIISHGQLTGGSALTREFAKQHRKPWIHLDMADLSLETAADRLIFWIERNDIKVLNVAGPRASKDPKIYQATIDLLEKMLIPLFSKAQ